MANFWPLPPKQYRRLKWMVPKGAFTNYVDKILPISDHLPTSCWHFCWNSFTGLRENTVDVSSINLLHLVNVVCEYPLRDHPYITSAKGLGGSRKWPVLLTFSAICIYADKVGWWGPKRPKINWRNIGMVPNANVGFLKFLHTCLCWLLNKRIVKLQDFKYF